MVEVWKDVVGYEGLYQVSNTGKVKRMSGYKKRKDGQVRYFKEKEFTGRGKRPYKRAELWKDGEGKTFYIHRLVALSFVPAVSGKEYINHKDGNPENNNYTNLEWCTSAENNIHAMRTGLRNHGYKVQLTRLKDQKVFSFPTQREASHFIGRAQSVIGWSVRNGKNPTDLEGNVYLVERV